MPIRGNEPDAVFTNVNEDSGRVVAILSKPAGCGQDLTQSAGKLITVKSRSCGHRLLLAAKQHLNRRKRVPARVEAPFNAPPVRVEHRLRCGGVCCEEQLDVLDWHLYRA
jgi:hypothetical protein